MLNAHRPTALVRILALPLLFAAQTNPDEPTPMPPNVARLFGEGTQTKINQGNPAIAEHAIRKEKCLAGLSGIVLQTADQKKKCGADNMVPVTMKQGGREATFCIDIFEYPNRACELPMVWASPTAAAQVCKAEGKRLCAQQEWNVACRSDPKGGEDQVYAYGNKLDLDICNTHKRHHTTPDGKACNPRTAKTAWETCTTDTEPAGAFPQCRSRAGVFDQHGNVAEIMTRADGSRTVSQLKGSAWFYTEVKREPNAPQPSGRQGTYPDHCNFDPRWHVEPIQNAQHVNYHLGFRCCKSVDDSVGSETQPQRVPDHRNGAETHRGGRDHR